MTRLPGWRGPVALVALLLGGVLLGLTGAVVQAGTTRVGSVDLPWGVPVVLAALAVTVRGSSWWVGSRLGGLAVAVGWLVASLVMASTGPGGDLLLPDDWPSRTYLLGGGVVAVVALLVRLPAGVARVDPGPDVPAGEPLASGEPPAGR